MNRFAILVAFGAAALAPAQQLVHCSTGPGLYVESDADTLVSALPDVTPNFWQPHLPLPPIGPGFDDLAFDNLNGVYYETNGALISQTVDIRYPPVPIAPGPLPAPANIGLLTGLAVDPLTATLWCTDGVVLLPLTSAPPFAPMAAPVPFAFQVLAPPMLGLEFDQIAGTLLGCDLAGFVYRFTGLGLPVGPQPAFAPPAMAAPPSSDLAVHRYGGMIPGLYVQFVGLGVVNYLTGGLQPSGALGLPPGSEGGLAFHNRPVTLAATCPCLKNPFLTVVGTTGPATVGSASFGMQIMGAPPFTPVILAGDFVGAAPTAWPGGCTYWLPMPPLLMFLTATDALGTAAVPMPIPALPPLVGLIAFTQWAIPCISNPTGVVLSDAQFMVVGAP